MSLYPDEIERQRVKRVRIKCYQMQQYMDLSNNVIGTTLFECWLDEAAIDSIPWDMKKRFWIITDEKKEFAI